MREPAAGEAVAHLPWLSPCAASLLTLARPPTPAGWLYLRTDPGAVLLVVRHLSAADVVAGPSRYPSLLHEPDLAETAAWHLEHSPGCFVDWSQPSLRPVYQVSRTIAKLARQVAKRSGRCDPEHAWVAGLLAPLGWLAMSAIAPARVEACLDDPELRRHPAKTQRHCWGLDQSAVARRLARYWRLPAWLAALTGELGLPADQAQRLGADAELFRVVQLAVALAQRPGATLHLKVGTNPAENAAALGLPVDELETSGLAAGSDNGQELPPAAWDSPSRQPLLRELLILAAENRRLRGTSAREKLESSLDALHQALEEQCAGEAERLQVRKLAALAEFAAGAGHEINNPLAVISGQAQYLIRKVVRGQGSGVKEDAAEPSSLTPDPCPLTPGLQAIIDQAQRIHGILRDLWQFARPPQPSRQPIDLPGLVSEVSTSLSDYAAQCKVELRSELPEPAVARSSGALLVLADPGQLRTALSCLVRNAIEAAPAGGWAEVRLETPGPDQVHVLVEDSGTPPALPQREHLFDPFYSGRPAGRGRGLGLPTAWRLVRAQGGDVRFAGLPGGPTRFVLSLPRSAVASGQSPVASPDGEPIPVFPDP